jgi:hypothetical protein
MTAPSTPPVAAAAETQPARATFTNVSRNGAPFEVHFNPVSLQIALSNTLEEKGTGQDKKQYVSKSSSKLTMDLVFDTTDSGSDVRGVTGQVAAFMEAQGADESHRAPPTVLFEWGVFKFQGLVESYRETVEFFSHDGIPLRASVNLTMSRQTVVFSDDSAPARTTAVNVPAAAGNASQIASQSGNPNAGRGLATANGLESMRFSTGPISVDASVKLGGPVAFASGGVGAGIGVGISGGIGASAGLSVGGGAAISLSAGASASASGPAFGGSASAGVSATDGAFAGLRASTQLSGPTLDPSRMVARAEPNVVDAGPQASFGIGGMARATGSASLGTDVGAGPTAQARVRFDGA